jgi:signal recognition particle GTPase
MTKYVKKGKSYANHLIDHLIVFWTITRKKENNPKKRTKRTTRKKRTKKEPKKKSEKKENQEKKLGAYVEFQVGCNGVLKVTN